MSFFTRRAQMEVEVQKMNKNHDKNNGQFTSGHGSAKLRTSTPATGKLKAKGKYADLDPAYRKELSVRARRNGTTIGVERQRDEAKPKTWKERGFDIAGPGPWKSMAPSNLPSQPGDIPDDHEPG